MRILFIGMGFSVHTARWIAQLDGLGWDLHFVSVDYQPLHPDLRNVTVHDPVARPELAGRVKQSGVLWPFYRGTYLARLATERIPGNALARVIRKVKPDLIHVLHMQHAGYQLLEAADAISCPIVYSSWGSDVYYYSKFPEELPKIRAFLALCDFHFSDCQRDVKLVRDFGFRGKTLGVYPACGGFEFGKLAQFRSPLPPSKRRIVAIKGYHQPTFAGRALVGLHALMTIQDQLRGFEIVVFAATENTRHAAEFMRRVTGLDIKVMPRSSDEELYSLLGRARIFVGLSVTDGTPISLLEAMMMGAFPVQSDTTSTAEWIRDGESGFLVSPEDHAAVARAITKALTDDALVDAADQRNTKRLNPSIERETVRQQVIADYRRVHTD